MNSARSIQRAIRAAFIAGLGLVALAGASGPALAAAPEDAPPVAPGQSRVWFVRQLLAGTNFHPPIVYVNGAAIGIAAQGTAFYRDFVPGRYAFTVENCLPQAQTGQTMNLQPNAQYAIEVTQDDNAAWDCNPPQVSYLRQVPPQQVSYLFAQVTYQGAR